MRRSIAGAPDLVTPFRPPAHRRSPQESWGQRGAEGGSRAGAEVGRCGPDLAWSSPPGASEGIPPPSLAAAGTGRSPVHCGAAEPRGRSSWARVPRSFGPPRRPAVPRVSEKRSRHTEGPSGGFCGAETPRRLAPSIECCLLIGYPQNCSETELYTCYRVHRVHAFQRIISLDGVNFGRNGVKYFAMQGDNQT
eukprot:scaffold1954_cov268-Pinguiococcus_pyrenoidosus.AAC.280